MTIQEAAIQLADSLGHSDHPDYLGSEDASAMLLDAMPTPLLNRNRDRFPEEQWACSEDVFKGICHYSADRKTVVFLAALAWKQIERPDGL